MVKIAPSESSKTISVSSQYYYSVMFSTSSELRRFKNKHYLRIESKNWHFDESFGQFLDLCKITLCLLVNKKKFVYKCYRRYY